MDKALILSKVIEDIEHRIQVLKDAAIEARDASTNEESKAENKYDTRGLEAGYLAQGQALRAKEMEETLFHLKKLTPKPFEPTMAIGITALVVLSSEEQAVKWFFLVPASGITVSFNDKKIQTLSLDSPLGKRLIGLETGDQVELKGRLYEIEQIF